jgi:uncharacterized protein
VRPSYYNLYLDRGEQTRIVSLLTGTVVEIDQAPANELRAGIIPSLPEALYAELAASLMLVPDRFDERKFVLARTAQAREARDQLSLIVVPTLGCNLSCHYCFEAKRDETLSGSAMDDLGATVAASLKDYDCLHVQWFGGEPLQALPQISMLSDQLRNLCAIADKPYAAEIITNGVLMTSEVAQKLRSWGVESAQVTFDGGSRLHDKVRFGNRHALTFDKIVENMAAASQHLRIKVRVHVAPYNIDSVYELLDELAHRLDAGKVDTLYFAPISNYSQSAEGHAFERDDRRFLSSADFAKVQSVLLEHAWKLGFRTPDPLGVAHGICAAASGSSIVINADGSLTKCYMDVGDRKQTLGDVSQFAEVMTQSNKWSEYAIDDDECLSCKFLTVCLGGCPKQKMEEAEKAMVCTPLKYNYEAVLREFVWDRSSTR